MSSNIDEIVKCPDFLPIELLSKINKKRKDKILKRSNNEIEKVMPLVKSIVREIQQKGDKALLNYTRKFDNVNLTSSKLIVSKSEIKDAYNKVNKENSKLIGYMQNSIECNRKYHELEKEYFGFNSKKWEEAIKAKAWKLADQKCYVGQKIVPIKRIGLYVPSGNAVLFTTALMGVTPAKVAGVEEIIVSSPPSCNGDIDPKIIVAADLAGADLIIRAGGAQAIAALACGTKTITKVDKIFGPGNIFVTAAKAYVASISLCEIDFLAGPSEIIVIADKTANVEYIASDMISQAEHDVNACSILLTDTELIADKTREEIIKEILKQLEDSSRLLMKIAVESFKNYGAIIKVKDINEAIYFTNEFAPEHLEIMTQSPRKWLKKVRNAGTVCLGKYTPVAVSDYICPNHILPTGGGAKYTSGINIGMFFKKISLLKTNGSYNMFNLLDKSIGKEGLSYAEGLYDQHGRSIAVRFKYIKGLRSKK